MSTTTVRQCMRIRAINKVTCKEYFLKNVEGWKIPIDSPRTHSLIYKDEAEAMMKQLVMEPTFCDWEDYTFKLELADIEIETCFTPEETAWDRAATQAWQDAGARKV